MAIVMDADNDTVARRYLLTINNTKDMQDYFKAIIEEDLEHLKYACMSDEIGLESEIYHTHIFLSFDTNVRFTKIKNLFPKAHIDACAATSSQVKDYVFKEGKWENDIKSDTNLRDTHYEYNTLEQAQGKRTDIERVRDMILQGKSDLEIKMTIPSALRYTAYMTQFRNDVQNEYFSKHTRDIVVHFLYGGAGTGKTSYVFQKHAFEDIFICSLGEHAFDEYKGQKVIVFDDFRDTDIKLNTMLRLLDRYPLLLPARYANKVACYTEVYITSNVSLQDMYKHADKKSYIAFQRRISEYLVFEEDNIYEYAQITEFGNWVAVNEPLANELSTSARQKNDELEFDESFTQLLQSIDFNNLERDDY